MVTTSESTRYFNTAWLTGNRKLKWIICSFVLICFVHLHHFLWKCSSSKIWRSLGENVRCCEWIMLYHSQADLTDDTESHLEVNLISDMRCSPQPTSLIGLTNEWWANMPPENRKLHQCMTQEIKERILAEGDKRHQPPTQGTDLLLPSDLLAEHPAELWIPGAHRFTLVTHATANHHQEFPIIDLESVILCPCPPTTCQCPLSYCKQSHKGVEHLQWNLSIQYLMFNMYPVSKVNLAHQGNIGWTRRLNYFDHCHYFTGTPQQCTIAAKVSLIYVAGGNIKLKEQT